MPALEVYGAQPPIELLRQWMDFKGWYDRKAIGDFRRLVDVNFICAMGPPGGGRNPVTPRLMRHFNYLAFTELEDQSKKKIFSTILGWWMESSPGGLREHCSTLVSTCIEVYNTITTQLLPTPAKSHYTFNLRDLSKVFQGILMGDSSKLKVSASMPPHHYPLFKSSVTLQGVPDLLRLWYHESLRVFSDRLVNDDDRTWFSDQLKGQMKSKFNTAFEDVVQQEPVLYGDFMVANVDNRPYQEIEDHAKMVKVVEEYLEDYNQINTAQMRLVMFMDAIRHLCRIARIIRQPLGNALLLGMGGSGRQSLTRLAAHM